MPKFKLQADSTILASIKEVAPFASVLTEYLTKFSTDVSFTKLPDCFESEAGNKRLSDGVYLCSCKSGFSPANADEACDTLLDLMSRELTERRDDIEHLKTVFKSDVVEPSSFLKLVAQNREENINELIEEHKLAEDLLPFFAVFFARPFRMAAARHLTAGLDMSLWNRGYCPVCGHWAALGHIHQDEGARTLWCSHCDTKWHYPRIKCVFCETTDQDNLEILHLEGDTVYRTQVCSRCRRYLKEIRSEVKADGFNFLENYLGTSVLDLMADQEEYFQDSALSVRYEETEENQLLMHRQKLGKKYEDD